MTVTVKVRRAAVCNVHGRLVTLSMRLHALYMMCARRSLTGIRTKRACTPLFTGRHESKED